MVKRGWVRLVEMTIAILLISGLLFLFIGKNQIKKEDISLQVYEAEAIVLKEIQLNETLRQKIIIIDAEELPVEWTNFNSQGLEEVALKIEQRIPSYLKCEAIICALDESCDYPFEKNENIYAQSVAITSTKTSVSFRQLKLFCWVK